MILKSILNTIIVFLFYACMDYKTYFISYKDEFEIQKIKKDKNHVIKRYYDGRKYKPKRLYVFKMKTQNNAINMNDISILSDSIYMYIIKIKDSYTSTHPLIIPFKNNKLIKIHYDNLKYKEIIRLSDTSLLIKYKMDYKLRDCERRIIFYNTNNAIFYVYEFWIDI